MRSTSEITFDREPITNVIYNRIVNYKNIAKPSSHGCYIPALKMIDRVLEVDSSNKNCALVVMFLSDGRPSD